MKVTNTSLAGIAGCGALGKLFILFIASINGAILFSF
jgi:hypothetical protein